MQISKKPIFDFRMNATRLLILVLFLILFLILPSGKGHALYATLSSGGLTSMAPRDVLNTFYNYNYNFNEGGNSICYLKNGNAQNPLATAWVSPSGNPTVDLSIPSASSIPGSSGATEYFTDWNAIFFCRVNLNNLSEEILTPPDNTAPTSPPPPDAQLSNNVLGGFYTYIKRNPSISTYYYPQQKVTPGATISGLSKGTLIHTQPLNPTEPDRYFFSSHNFSIKLPTIPPSEVASVTKIVVNVSIPIEDYNVWYGQYYCVQGPSNLKYSSLQAAETGKCNNTYRNFSITFSITPSPTCTSNCCTTSTNSCTHPPTPVPCATPAPGADTQDITVSSPISGYQIVSTLSTPADSTSNATIYEAVPGEYRIDSAHDQYSPPTYIISSPTPYQSSPTFKLDYYQYLEQYPYDNHKTSVVYDQKAQVEAFTASFAYYRCGPNNVNSATCYTTYNCVSTTSSSCCGSSVASAPGITSNSEIITASEVALLFRGTGGGGSGTGGTTYTCYTIHYGVAWYSFSGGGSSIADFPGTAINIATLKEYCPRNFDVLSPTSTDVLGVSLTASGTTPDQPNKASVDTQTTVQFTLPAPWSQQVRHALAVNGIDYTGNYYIVHANGNGQIPIDSPDNQTFNITGSFSPGNAVYPYNTTFAVSEPPLEVGDQICAEFSDSPQSGDVNEYGAITNAQGTVDSTQIPTPPTCSNPMANYPYSRAYGNDVMAGTVFSNAPVNQCNSSASITASITPDSGQQPRGSGVQFAALSLGQIQYFASAFLRNSASGPPFAPNGLTLANTTGSYGGSYGGGCQSVYNYYQNRSPGATKVFVAIGNTYGILSNSGPVKLEFGNNISNNFVSLVANSGNSSTKVTGEHVVYINGNIFIPNNITYDSSGVSYDASTGTVSGVPNLYVIASGNIYIGPNVTQLDGTYVAQSSCDWSSGPCQGGIINTCSDPSGLYGIIGNSTDSFSPDSLYSNCSQQLTIQGSLIGHEVKLERTYASMRNSVGGENPLSGSVHSCQLGNGNISPAAAQDCSAEIFNFDPINYLGNPNFSSNGYNIDSIISLPPVL